MTEQALVARHDFLTSPPSFSSASMDQRNNLAYMRAREMIDIERMCKTSYVSAARDYRKSILQIHKMNLVEQMQHDTNSVAMERWIREGMVPMACAVEANYSKFGLCPYRIVQRRMYAGDDEGYKARAGPYAKQFRDVHVAVPMELGTYTVETLVDDQGVKQVLVLDKQGDPIDTFVESQYRTGPSTTGPEFDSEGGALVPEFRRLERRLQLAEKILDKHEKPVLFLRKEVAAASQQNDTENQRFDDLVERTRDEHGYLQEKEFQLQVKDGVVLLPPHINTTPYQPQPPARIDEAAAVEAFVKLVAAIYRVPPRKLIPQGETTMSHRSESAVDEDRGEMCAALNEIASDLVHAMEMITIRLFAVPIPMAITLRPQADRQVFHELHELGLIDDTVLRDEIFNLIGLPKSRGITRGGGGGAPPREERTSLFGRTRGGDAKTSRRLKKLLTLVRKSMNQIDPGNEQGEDRVRVKRKGGIDEKMNERKKRMRGDREKPKKKEEEASSEDEGGEEGGKKRKPNGKESDEEQGKKKKRSKAKDDGEASSEDEEGKPKDKEGKKKKPKAKDEEDGEASSEDEKEGKPKAKQEEKKKPKGKEDGEASSEDEKSKSKKVKPKDKDESSGDEKEVKPKAKPKDKDESSEDEKEGKKKPKAKGKESSEDEEGDKKKKPKDKDESSEDEDGEKKGKKKKKGGGKKKPHSGNGE